MANEEKKLVEIENLRKYFPIKGTNGPGVQAVQDVSLYIKNCLLYTSPSPRDTR